MLIFIYHFRPIKNGIIIKHISAGDENHAREKKEPR